MANWNIFLLHYIPASFKHWQSSKRQNPFHYMFYFNESKGNFYFVFLLLLTLKGLLIDFISCFQQLQYLMSWLYRRCIVTHGISNLTKYWIISLFLHLFSFTTSSKMSWMGTNNPCYSNWAQMRKKMPHRSLPLPTLYCQELSTGELPALSLLLRIKATVDLAGHSVRWVEKQFASYGPIVLLGPPHYL